MGSEDTGEVVFCGQRVRKQNGCVIVDQDKAIEELTEIPVPKDAKDETACTPQQHTAYRSLLGSLNWLQSRTQFQIAYKFSRAASAAASPTIGNTKELNKVVRIVRSAPQQLKFWPLKGNLRIVGFSRCSVQEQQ